MLCWITATVLSTGWMQIQPERSIFLSTFPERDHKIHIKFFPGKRLHVIARLNKFRMVGWFVNLGMLVFRQTNKQTENALWLSQVQIFIYSFNIMTESGQGYQAEETKWKSSDTGKQCSLFSFAKFLSWF